MERGIQRVNGPPLAYPCGMISRGYRTGRQAAERVAATVALLVIWQCSLLVVSDLTRRYPGHPSDSQTIWFLVIPASWILAVLAALIFNIWTRSTAQNVVLVLSLALSPFVALIIAVFGILRPTCQYTHYCVVGF
jgi:hypothetical protein